MYRNAIVIDDSPLERLIADRVIKMTNFAADVRLFAAADEAFTYLATLNEDQFPEVIFVDIQMPVMNGFQFLDKFMDFPDDIKQGCKICMLSSTLLDEDYDRIKRYPVVSKFLPKPLSVDAVKNLSL